MAPNFPKKYGAHCKLKGKSEIPLVIEHGNVEMVMKNRSCTLRKGDIVCSSIPNGIVSVWRWNHLPLPFTPHGNDTKSERLCMCLCGNNDARRHIHDLCNTVRVAYGSKHRQDQEVGAKSQRGHLILTCERCYAEGHTKLVYSTGSWWAIRTSAWLDSGKSVIVGLLLLLCRG